MGKVYLFLIISLCIHISTCAPYLPIDNDAPIMNDVDVAKEGETMQEDHSKPEPEIAPPRTEDYQEQSPSSEQQDAPVQEEALNESGPRRSSDRNPKALAITRSSSNMKPNGVLVSRSLSKARTRGNTAVTAGGDTEITNGASKTAAATKAAAESHGEDSKALAVNRTISKLKPNGVTVIKSINRNVVKGDAESESEGTGKAEDGDSNALGHTAGGGTSTGNGVSRSRTQTITKILPNGETKSSTRDLPFNHKNHNHKLFV